MILQERAGGWRRGRVDVAMMLMTIAMDRRTASSMALAMACGAEGGDNGAHGYDDGDGDADESM